MMTTDQLKLKVDRARTWALTSNHADVVFYAQLIMNLKDKFEPVGTANVDGRTIRWDANYLEKLTDEKTRYVLLHESAGHCGLGHFWRLPINKYGNIAGDYKIEKMLRGIPGIEPPEGILICPPEYENLSEEEIVKILQKKDSEENQEQGSGKPDQTGPDQDQDGDGDRDGDDESSQDDSEGDQDGDDTQDGDDGQEGSRGDSGDSDGDQDGTGTGHGTATGDTPGTDDRYTDVCGGFIEPAEDLEQNESLEDEWKQHIIQANFNAQLGRGTTPADMARQIERIRHTPLDWKNELADFLKAQAGQRNDWSRSARRHAWQSVIYPRKKEDIATVIVVRDTSGSVDNEMCGRFTTMGEQCCAETGCRAILMDVDISIHREDELEPGDEWPLEALGGGGTIFSEPFRRAKERLEAGERIAGIVYWTDLDGRHSDDWNEEVPTLWITHSDRIAPFGRTVKVEP